MPGRRDRACSPCGDDICSKQVDGIGVDIVEMVLGLGSIFKWRPAARGAGMLMRSFPQGIQIEVAGLVIGRQRPGTASGVTFITLEDETGLVNLVVMKTVFAESYGVARHARMMLVAGRLERQGTVIHVLAKKLARLRLPGGEEPNVRSRDFH
jgi:hypothetical protein